MRTAYNQWTQFEEFPQFMEGVEQVAQLDDSGCTGSPTSAAQEEEWDAEITEQNPDERVAWTSHEGGTSTPASSRSIVWTTDRTRVMLQMEYDPEGIVEKVGDKLGVRRAGASRATWSASRSSSSRAASRPARGAATSRTDPPVPPGPAA